MTFEGKDLALLAAAAVSLLTGVGATLVTLWIGRKTLDIGRQNLEETRKGGKTTRYIHTVTNQRIAWIEQLRQDLAAFISLANEFSKTSENQIELNRLRHVIRLRLNPKGEIDKDIRKQVDEAYELSRNSVGIDKYAPPMLKKLSEKLTERGQDLLKEEWEKVKSEAEHGKLD